MRSTALAWVLLASCHAERALESPPVTGEGSLLLIVERDGKIDQVWATDIAKPNYPPLYASSELVLTAVEFRCRLAALRLTPGEQTLKDVEHRRPLLPAPKQSFVSTISSERQAPWDVADGIPSVATKVLLRLPLEDDHLCQIYNVPFESFDASFHETNTSSTPAFGLRLDDGTVLVGTLSGQFLIVSETAPTMRLTQISTTTPHAGAFRREDGEIFLRGEDGRTARGNEKTGFMTLSAQGTGGVFEHVRLDGDPAGSIDLFAATDARAFEHFDGLRWTTLATAAPDIMQGNFRSLRRPTVAWIGPREALVTHMNPENQTEIWRYRDGRKDGVEIPFERQGVRELFNFPGWGVVAGGSAGSIAFRDASGAWGEQVDVFPGNSIRSMMPLGDNLLIWAFFGFAQYHRLAGSCLSNEMYTGGFVRNMIPLGEESILLLLVNMDNPRDAVQMTTLKKGEHDPCLDEQ